jgi:hypothetical protein
VGLSKERLALVTAELPLYLAIEFEADSVDETSLYTDEEAPTRGWDPARGDEDACARSVDSFFSCFEACADEEGLDTAICCVDCALASRFREGPRA